MLVKVVLDNGVKIIAEDVPAAQSVSIGAWVACGSRGECDATSGISHFIEHMLFKGTSSRSAYDIASQVEATGGSINAVTGKEHTSYLKVPACHLELGMEVLADMLKNLKFLDSDIESEKGVVLSEIGQLEDTADEYIYDVFEELLWQDHRLRLPILGSKKSVKNFNRDDISDFFQSRYYEAPSILVSIAGAIDLKEAIEAASKLFGSIGCAKSAQVKPQREEGSQPKPFHILRKVIDPHFDEYSMVVAHQTL